MELNPVHLGAALGGLLLLLVIVKVLRGSRGEPGYVEEVRSAVNAGNYKRAGELQLRHGNLQQAYNLFERGEVHEQAAEAAKRLGMTEKAAGHYEKAGELELAAELFDEAGRSKDAARLYKRVGRFKEAAALLEKDSEAQPLEIARLWEAWYVDCYPRGNKPMNEHKRKRLKEAAERAAEAYKRAGHLERALHFLKAAKATAVNDDDTGVPSESEFIGDARPGGAGDMTLGELPPLPPANVKRGSPTASDSSVSSGRYEPLPSGSYGDAYHDAVLRARTLGPEESGDTFAEPAPIPPIDSAPPVASMGGLPPEASTDLVSSLPDAPKPEHDFQISGPEDEPIIEGELVFEPVDQRPESGSSGLGLTPASADRPTEHEEVSYDRPPSIPDLPEIPDLPPLSSTLDKAMVSEVVSQVLNQVADRNPNPTVARLEVVHIHDATSNGTTELARESDRYLLKEQIGAGGMAVVYKATDKVLERDIALKFLPENITLNPTATELFEKEAKQVAKLNHPNIVTIHDYGVMQSRPFICMELIVGETLGTIIDRYDESGLPVDEALLLADGLLAALEYAHGRSVVHRDIKPGNVMRTENGTIKLMDFGIAKIMDSDHTTKIAGTPSYMAPEQMSGKGVDHRCDLFAVGVTLYEMLTGFLPFEGIRRDTEPIPMAHLRDELPEGLDAVVAGCLRTEKKLRPESAQALRGTLAQFLSSPGVRMPVSPAADSYDPVAELRAAGSDAPSLLAERADEPTPQVILLFKAALDDTRPDVRSAALEMFPGSVGGELLELLLDALKDEAKEVRLAAYERIGESNDESLLPRLADRLRFGQSAVIDAEERLALMRNIVELGGAAAVKLFRSLLEESKAAGDSELHAERMSEMELALSELDSTEAINLLKSAKMWTDPEGQSSIDDSVAIDIDIVPPEEVPPALNDSGPLSNTQAVGRPASFFQMDDVAGDPGPVHDGTVPGIGIMDAQTVPAPDPRVEPESADDHTVQGVGLAQFQTGSGDGNRSEDEYGNKKLPDEIQRLLMDYLGSA